MAKTLNKPKTYAGKFIATASFNTKTIIASGKDPIKVRGRAVQKGYDSPVVVYVPDVKMYNIY